jgi:hypothetical protein
MTFDGAQQGDEPARPRPSGEKTPGTTRARTKPGGRRRREGRIRRAEGRLSTSAAFGLCSPSRRRARRLRRGDALTHPSRSSRARRRSPPGVHPHQPPPAAARTRKDVQGEHPAQQRRPPRRTLTRRSHRRRGALRLSLGAPRNHRRPPRRVRREHPVKAQRVKTRGRNQQRQLLDELQRIQWQVGRPIRPQMRQLEHHLPARALRQARQRQRRAQKHAPARPRSRADTKPNRWGRRRGRSGRHIPPRGILGQQTTRIKEGELSSSSRAIV